MWREVDDLEVVGNSDEDRSRDAAAAAQRCKRAVVEASAHAEPVAAQRRADEGNQADVERVELQWLAGRLVHAPPMGAAVAVVGHEVEPVALDARKAPTALEPRSSKCGGRELAVDRVVGGDGRVRSHPRTSTNCRSDGIGGGLRFARRSASTLVAEARAQLVTLGAAVDFVGARWFRDHGDRVAPMFGGNEWLIVVIAVVVLFGGSQIPKLAKNLGSAQKEFKKGLAEGARDDDADTDSPA